MGPAAMIETDEHANVNVRTVERIENLFLVIGIPKLRLVWLNTRSGSTPLSTPPLPATKASALRLTFNETAKDYAATVLAMTIQQLLCRFLARNACLVSLALTCFALLLSQTKGATAVESNNVVAVAATTTNSVVEQEYARLQAQEESAQEEIAKWHKNKTPGEDLEEREHERLEPIRKSYEEFISRNPSHVRARLDFGSFLNELHDRSGAKVQWEKALELEPQNADAYNCLAGVYSAIGPAEKCFEYYARAIQLDPSAAAYYHNFGDTLYVLRKSAMQYYKLNEQQVYLRALEFYSNAVRLEPTNFSYAWDFAQTHYVIKPLPTDAALRSWTNTLKSARDSNEREGVYLHLARTKMLAGNTREARAQLENVTNAPQAELKARLLRSIEERERDSSSTNRVEAQKSPK
jgi:Tfp pilus assembly protein PilF